jgi:four helix bundle protein
VRGSRLGFNHKYGIAQKEARESLYWLRLLADSGIAEPKRLAPLMQEREQLYAVITAIIVNAKGREKGKGYKDEG